MKEIPQTPTIFTPLLRPLRLGLLLATLAFTLIGAYQPTFANCPVCNGPKPICNACSKIADWKATKLQIEEKMPGWYQTIFQLQQEIINEQAKENPDQTKIQQAQQLIQKYQSLIQLGLQRIVELLQAISNEWPNCDCYQTPPQPAQPQSQPAQPQPQPAQPQPQPAQPQPQPAQPQPQPAQPQPQPAQPQPQPAQSQPQPAQSQG